MTRSSSQDGFVEDFPVHWADPSDAHRYWQQHSQHFPHQITPLEFDAFVLPVMDGIGYASKKLDLAIRGWRALRVNTYVYRTVITDDDTSRSEAGTTTPAGVDDSTMQAAVDDLTRAWQADYLPEVQGFLDEFEALDLTAQSEVGLVETLNGALLWMERLWQLHMLTVLPAYAAVNEFTDTYRDLFGAGAALDPYSLLSGFSNKTVEAAQALWDLAKQAAGEPELADLLRTVPAEDVMEALGQTHRGRDFLRSLEEYLHLYGQRGDLCSLTAVSWIEDPTPVLRNLTAYLDQPDENAPKRAVDRAAIEREKVVSAAHQRLATYPRPVVELFDHLLNAAQTGSALTEDHTFYIDYCGIYQIRRVILEIGHRLVENGSIDTANDVFLLGADGLRQALTTTDPSIARAVVSTNRDELARFADVTPPPVLGDGKPPRVGGAFGRFHSNMFGGADNAEDEPATEPGVWRGASGSSGTARGTARVIRTLADAGRLASGDILVAPTTAPPWTPLFAVAAGVVTDTGGALSHCAIVAREYGLPAVVGATGATQSIPDGQLIEVDGDHGIVRLVEPQ